MKLIHLICTISSMAIHLTTEAKAATSQCRQGKIIYQLSEDQYLTVSPQDGEIQFLDESFEVFAEYTFKDMSPNTMDLTIDLKNNRTFKLMGKYQQFSFFYKGPNKNIADSFNCFGED